ncbi:hypothetical protein [Cohnella sp. GbtcB17]|uniref:hypothetical protein n=1 Tax=Cohnella sp. GbtcB17 TaxID=2824762 RepID=UPI001C30CD63|nr:hypothetical protein [Cohnella sp. GbtcB17]
MRVPKLAKALLLSAAVFTAATPAYAFSLSTTPISNTLTSTFKIKALPSFLLQWTDEQGVVLTGNALPEIEADAEDESLLYIKAKVNQDYDYQVMFKVTRTDNKPIAEDDVVIREYKDDGTTSTRSGTYLDDDTKTVYYWSRSRLITSASAQNLKFDAIFAVDGNFKIEAAAVEGQPT